MFNWLKSLPGGDDGGAVRGPLISTLAGSWQGALLILGSSGRVGLLLLVRDAKRLQGIKRAMDNRYCGRWLEAMVQPVAKPSR